MDGFINSSIEKQTIYEIYRACRLCGAGAGYKMPIMQNVVHLDSAEVELRQKIRECVQIEVHQEDKMPPLICELCVDKVNDFYEFLEMCRHTNKRTRLRLGLPPQTMPRGAPDAGDCILGVTEPVFLNEDSNESLLKPRGKNKGKFKKESIKFNLNEVRSLRSKHTSPPQQRASKRSREEDMSLSKLQKTSTRQSVATPRSILRKEEVTVEEEWSPTRSKRSRDSRDSKPETIKKVKIMVKPLPTKPSPKPDFKCKTCKAQFNNSRALNNHMRSHNKPQPTYKSTSKQEKNNSCSKCNKDFPTKLSLNRHKCPNTSANKCGNCGRHISNVRNLASHERACQSRKELKISPKLLKQLKPIQIRVKRCDALLKRVGERYDVSGVDCNFGLDKNCIYPYLTSLRIKTEPSYMVNIHDTIDEFDLNQDYVHWDSDSSESGLEIRELGEKSVGTLANLSLRTIFSHKFLGKVPKRKRKVKPDKAYDSLINFGSDVRLGIDNIINSLDKNVNDIKDTDNDSLFGDDKTPAVSNDDFDSLFCSNNDSECNLNDKRKPDNEIGEILNKNNEIESKKNDILTEVGSNDTVKNTQENDKSESIKNTQENDNSESIKNTKENDKSETNEVVPDNVNISDNKDKVLISAQNSIINDTENKEDIEEIILKNKYNIDKVEKTDEESSCSINNVKTVHTDKVIENNDSLFKNETENSTENINHNYLESNAILNEKVVSIDSQDAELSGVNYVENNGSPDNDNKVHFSPLKEKVANSDKVNKDALHVNGDDKLDPENLEDISDTEMDDSRLMDAIDEQIGEKKTEDKSQDNERDSISVVKSADLESISSEELLNE